ncbi:MAG: TlpA family protein disulfide reductase [Ideonella sp.]|nr:TlpA family protein disulfide reductase [Ideonella sp.]
MKRLVKVLFMLALAALGQPAASAELPMHAAAPDFTLRALTGPTLRLAEQRGHVVLVNFWASWCGPCRQEMPQLNRLHDKYRAAGLVLVGVNIDDDPRLAAEVVTRYQLRFPVLLDTDKAVVKRYDLGAMPATVLIDRDGRVRQLHRGYREGLELTYDQQIRELIKE